MRANEFIAEASPKAIERKKKELDKKALRAAEVYSTGILNNIRDEELAAASRSASTEILNDIPEIVASTFENSAGLPATHRAVSPFVAKIVQILKRNFDDLDDRTAYKTARKELVPVVTKAFRTALDQTDRQSGNQNKLGIEDGSRIEFGRIVSKDTPTNKMLVKQGNRLLIFVNTRTNNVFEPAAEIDSKKEFAALQHPGISYQFEPGIIRVKPTGRIEIIPMHD